MTNSLKYIFKRGVAAPSERRARRKILAEPKPLDSQTVAVIQCAANALRMGGGAGNHKAVEGTNPDFSYFENGKEYILQCNFQDKHGGQEEGLFSAFPSFIDSHQIEWNRILSDRCKKIYEIMQPYLDDPNNDDQKNILKKYIAKLQIGLTNQDNKNDIISFMKNIMDKKLKDDSTKIVRDLVEASYLISVPGNDENFQLQMLHAPNFNALGSNEYPSMKIMLREYLQNTGQEELVHQQYQEAKKQIEELSKKDKKIKVVVTAIGTNIYAPRRIGGNEDDKDLSYIDQIKQYFTNFNKEFFRDEKVEILLPIRDNIKSIAKNILEKKDFEDITKSEPKLEKLEEYINKYLCDPTHDNRTILENYVLKNESVEKIKSNYLSIVTVSKLVSLFKKEVEQYTISFNADGSKQSHCPVLDTDPIYDFLKKKTKTNSYDIKCYIKEDKRVFVITDTIYFSAICQKRDEGGNWITEYYDITPQRLKEELKSVLVKNDLGSFIKHDGTCGMGAAAMAIAYFNDEENFNFYNGIEINHKKWWDSFLQEQKKEAEAVKRAPIAKVSLTKSPAEKAAAEAAAEAAEAARIAAAEKEAARIAAAEKEAEEAKKAKKAKPPPGDGDMKIYFYKLAKNQPIINKYDNKNKKNLELVSYYTEKINEYYQQYNNDSQIDFLFDKIDEETDVFKKTYNEYINNLCKKKYDEEKKENLEVALNNFMNPKIYAGIGIGFEYKKADDGKSYELKITKVERDSAAEKIDINISDIIYIDANDEKDLVNAVNKIRNLDFSKVTKIQRDKEVITERLNLKDCKLVSNIYSDDQRVPSTSVRKPKCKVAGGARHIEGGEVSC